MLEVDKIYHENLTPEKIDEILSGIASTNLASVDLSDSNTTKSLGSKIVEGLASKKEDAKPTAKKKTQRKKKKEIKPEPILHLTPVKSPVKKVEVDIEKELENIEKEISKEMQSSAKKESKKETALKAKTVKTKAIKKETVDKKTDRNKSQKDNGAEKQIDKPTKKDENKMSSLERAMLRSSDNGE